MHSLVCLPAGEERLWQGGEFWNSRDIVIFPVIGHAGAYAAEGRSFTPRSHGIARYADFSLLGRSDGEISLGIVSDKSTLAQYPYEFAFSVSYRLIKNSVEITYRVKSLGGNIPFYVGGHPGMYAPGGRAVIEFERTENALSYAVGSEAAAPLNGLKRFVADKKFFSEVKTFQLGGLSGGAIYALTDDGYRYTYRARCPVTAFWSNADGGDFICVEPWWGINDFPSAPREITLKPFINFDDGEGKTFAYTLTVEKQP